MAGVKLCNVGHNLGFESHSTGIPVHVSVFQKQRERGNLRITNYRGAFVRLILLRKTVLHILSVYLKQVKDKMWLDVVGWKM
jgi:hypothetical protein